MNIRKYVISVMLAVLVMGGCVFADENGRSGGVDLSQYSDEEVVNLLNQVQTELVNRQIEKTATLEKGTYTVGKDIPAGEYVLFKGADSGDGGIVWLRAADDPEDDWPSKLYEYVGREEESTKRKD